MKKVAVLQKGSKFAVYVNGELTLECFKKDNALMIKAILEDDELEMEDEKAQLLRKLVGTHQKENGIVRSTGYIV